MALTKTGEAFIGLGKVADMSHPDIKKAFKADPGFRAAYLRMQAQARNHSVGSDDIYNLYDEYFKTKINRGVSGSGGFSGGGASRGYRPGGGPYRSSYGGNWGRGAPRRNPFSRAWVFPAAYGAAIFGPAAGEWAYNRWKARQQKKQERSTQGGVA